MKLHLNLTLRRALLAAMAMVALHTADADMTPTNGHMYVTGEVSPTTEEWTEAWGSTTGVLSVGTSVGAGTLTLTSGDYTTPHSIFLGGKGYESNGSTASDGTLNIQEGATLTANDSTNVGNSQIGGTGYLTLNGGTLNAGNALYVGVNAGSGIVNVTDGGSITVASGSTGAVFAMSHRIISGLTDTVTLTGSSITVGAAGGVRDYTSIGHSAGTATLNLEAGSTATFHDQTIVGEMGGSNGTIYVTGGSTLNLGTVTVLGKEAGANGKIYIEGDDSILTADELVIGDKGTGTVEVTATANDAWENTYTISAKEITLGESASGRGTLIIGEAATVGKITNLRVGYEGIGTLTTEADIKTDTLAIAQSGSSVTVKNYSKVDTGYLSILGGTLNIATVDKNGDNTVYSEGYVYVSGATYTDAGSTINIAVGGELSTQGGSSEINGETIETVIGGKVIINGSSSDNGDFSYGSWNANGSTTMLGTLTNDGVLNVDGTMAALQGITGEGLVKVTSDTSSLTLGGTSEINSIDNDGTLTVNGSVETRLYGTGSTEVSENGILTLVDNTLSDDDKQVNSHEITNNGILNIKCKDTTYVDSGLITNNAQLNIYTDLANNIGGTGTATVKKDATWTLDSSAGYITQTQINVEEGAKLDINGVSFTDSEASPTGIPSIDNDGILSFDNVDLGIGYQNKGIVITGSGETVVEKGAHITIVGDSSQSIVTNSGSLEIAGGKTEVPTIANNGELVVMGDLTTTITGTGTTAVDSATLTLVGDNTQNAIMPWSGSKHVNLYGTLTLGEDLNVATTIFINSGTASGTAITAGSANAVVSVDIDTTNAVGLLGKDVTFVTIKDEVTSTNQGISSVNISGLTDDELKKGYKVLAEATENSGEQRLSFTATGDSTNGYTSIVFNKLAEKPADVTVEDTKKEVVYVDPDTGDEVTTTVDLDYEKQTLAHEEKTLDADKEIDGDLAAAIGVTPGSTTSAPILQTVSIDNASTTADTTAGDGEAKIGIVVGAGVESTSLAVQTVVVKQVTKDEKGEVLFEEAIGSTGMALVLEGTSTHEGQGDKENNHLGFADEHNGKEISTKDGETKKTQTIDLVQVGSNASVTLTNLNMHSTHTLEVKKGATITFNGVNMKVGGGIDTAIKTETVQVEVKDESGNVLTDNGKIITKEVTVENKNAAHLDTGSVIGDTETDPDKATETKVIIKGGSEVAFEKVRSADDKVELGTTTITGAKTEVVMDGEKTTLGMDSVVKDEQGNEKHGQKIVFSNGSHLKGNGNLKNIHIDKDSYFTVGSSPGKFSASELTVDGKTSFYIITDSDEWQDYAKTNKLSSDKREDGAAPGNWGAISQLVVEGSVTLNGQVTFIYQHFDDAAGEFVTEDTATAREEMKQYFKEGSSIKFVTYNGGSLTLGENFSVDLASLPELEDGLFWDVNSLFTENTVYVMAEILEEPTRIANSMVSAGETVLNFGRLAEAQASLREAGTTRTWGSAIAMFDSIDSGSTTNGYDYSNWGAAVGIDHAFTKNTVVGVAFGCTWGENEAKEDNGYYSAGSIDQDAKMIGIYGVHKFQTKGLLNDVKLSAFAAYGMFENDSTRNGLNSGNTAKAEWDSDAWVLSASLSRDITTDSGVVFTPYVGVEYTTAGMDDFSEQGKSYAADYSADEDYSNLSVKVGVGVSKTYGSITPYANVAFISDVDRTAGEVTANGKRTITGKSALPGRNGFEIGVGATWQLTENLDVNAGYSAEIRDKATEHNARLGVGYTF